MKWVRALLVVALVFLSATALYGGAELILHAHGSPWGMPLSLLEHSPFHSWLIPGIVLLGANGVLSLWVLWRVLGHRRHDGVWSLIQGCVLLGWLTVECILLRMVAWPHYFYGAVGVALVLAGAVLQRGERQAAAV